MLFLSFINDIHRSLSEITIKLFADDTSCFISDKDFNSLEKLVERELNKLQKMDKCKQTNNKFQSQEIKLLYFQTKK